MEMNLQQQVLAGNVWSLSEPATQVLRFDPATIAKAEVRVTRLPEWQDYFVLPLYRVYPLRDDKDRELVKAVEGEAVLEGIEPGTEILDYMTGLVGVHRTTLALAHTSDVHLGRYLFNAHNFSFTHGQAIVTDHPFKAIVLMEQGYENVLACMDTKLSPAQEMWLTVHAREGVVLIGVEKPEQHPEAHKFYPLQLEINPQAHVNDTGALRALFRS